jgi:hypothetical protein
VINGETLGARRKQRSKREGALCKREDGIGGKDIHLVGFDRHPSPDFAHGHAGHASQQAGQETCMRGVQVLDEDIGHAGCRWEVLQQPGERFESARRSSDAHHGTDYLRGRTLSMRLGCALRVPLALLLNTILSHRLLLSSLLVCARKCCCCGTENIRCISRLLPFPPGWHHGLRCPTMACDLRALAAASVRQHVLFSAHAPGLLGSKLSREKTCPVSLLARILVYTSPFVNLSYKVGPCLPRLRVLPPDLLRIPSAMWLAPSQATRKTTLPKEHESPPSCSAHGMSLKEVPNDSAGVKIARGFPTDHGRKIWKASWPGMTTVDDGVEFDTGLWFAAGITRVLHPRAIVPASFQMFGEGCAS